MLCPQVGGREMARRLCSGKGFVLLSAVSFAPLSQCPCMGGGGMYFVFSSKVCHGLDILLHFYYKKYLGK